jgi:hypothetical protein
MKEPAHKILIDRYLNWNLVKERLEYYKNIGKFYSLDNLKDCSTKAPYFCHYLAWRLGTWTDEQWFEFFDKLLDNATKLPNWNKTRVPQGCEFDNFWSFIWELQVAQLFSYNYNTSVEWMNSGPDLKVNSNVGQFFVECTIYRKSFGLEEFIGELLDHVHIQIRVSHIPFTIFSLPKNKNVEPFLDELCRPFLDEEFLEKKLKEVQEISPIILPTPNGIENLYIFIENHNAKNFNPYQPWTATGLPENFLDVIVKEVLGNKRSSNKLKLHRPNLLAVNLLLGVDFQLANAVRRAIPTPNLGAEYDAVFLTACGIDIIPSLKGFIYFYDDHPIKALLNQ